MPIIYETQDVDVSMCTATGFQIWQLAQARVNKGKGFTFSRKIHWAEWESNKWKMWNVTKSCSNTQVCLWSGPMILYCLLVHFCIHTLRPGLRACFSQSELTILQIHIVVYCTCRYTPVHLVESVENYACTELCMRRCFLCCSNMSVTHSALAFTHVNHTDASAKH